MDWGPATREERGVAQPHGAPERVRIAGAVSSFATDARYSVGMRSSAATKFSTALAASNPSFGGLRGAPASLGAPTVSADGRLVAVPGTIGRDGAVGVIALAPADGESRFSPECTVLFDSCQSKPVAWVGSGSAQVAAVNRSGVLVVIDVRRMLCGGGAVLSPCTETSAGVNVRELSGSSWQRSHVASCADDGQLVLTDVVRGTTIGRSTLSSPAGSVRFANVSFGVSATEDAGALNFYDARLGVCNEVARATFGERCYAHDVHAGGHGVLVGLETGDVLSYDRRNLARPLAAARDPFVRCVGDIRFDASGSSALVAGSGGFTRYSITTADGAAAVAHGSSPAPEGGRHYGRTSELVQSTGAYACAFVPLQSPDTVFATTSNGYVSTYHVDAKPAPFA